MKIKCVKDMFVPFHASLLHLEAREEVVFLTHQMIQSTYMNVFPTYMLIGLGICSSKNTAPFKLVLGFVHPLLTS